MNNRVKVASKQLVDNESIKCSTSSEQAQLMAATLSMPTSGRPGDRASKTASFFNNFVIEGIDQNGRTSMR